MPLASKPTTLRDLARPGEANKPRPVGWSPTGDVGARAPPWTPAPPLCAT